MVEPTTDTNRRPPSPRQGRLAWLAVAVAAGVSGCGLVPKSKLDECHRVSQTLRSENARLKDVALDLRTQNQDLSQRAVDDARRLAAYGEATERLETSVHGYQAERDKLAAAFEAMKRQVRTAVNPHPAARPERLKAFAEAHPGWTFDGTTMTLAAPADRLFARAACRLTPEADAAIRELAAELSGPGADALAVEVIGPAAAAPVVRAGYETGSSADPSASGRYLAASRGAKVRDTLAAAAGLDPARVRLAAPPVDTGDDAGRKVFVRLTTPSDGRAKSAPSQASDGESPGRPGGSRP